MDKNGENDKELNTDEYDDHANANVEHIEIQAAGPHLPEIQSPPPGIPGIILL